MASPFLAAIAEEAASVGAPVPCLDGAETVAAAVDRFAEAVRAHTAAIGVGILAPPGVARVFPDLEAARATMPAYGITAYHQCCNNDLVVRPDARVWREFVVPHAPPPRPILYGPYKLAVVFTKNGHWGVVGCDSIATGVGIASLAVPCLDRLLWVAIGRHDGAFAELARVLHDGPVVKYRNDTGHRYLAGDRYTGNRTFTFMGLAQGIAGHMVEPAHLEDIVEESSVDDFCAYCLSRAHNLAWLLETADAPPKHDAAV